jgi:glycosyltransferase involved in cell wall biosynthesis
MPPGAEPTFSIVIAAYQAESTVSEAVTSALTQTHPALEVIVCDDGSTDGTADVLKSFGGAITVIRQDNRGESAAKNRAVGQARGDYVVVLDADDVFLPRRLEALAWLATRHPDLDLLVTDAIVEADGEPMRRAYHPGWPFPTTDQRAAILDRNFVLGLCAVRRSVWVDAGGFDPQLAYAADWEFWQRLIFSGSRVGLVDEPLARYRLTRGTLSSHRVHLVRARLEVLSRASRWSSLTAAERRVLTLAIRRESRDLARRAANESLDRGGWPARREFAKILLGRGFGIRTRVGALFAVASPALAARRLKRRADGMVEIGAGLRVR